MRRSRFASALLVALLVLVLPQVASAKGFEAVRIVAASGKVGWIRGAAAKVWWSDFAQGQPADCACRSPDGAATFVHRLVGRWRGLGGGWPVGMLVQAGHHPPYDAPMVYYPASGTAPAYLAVPGGLGVGNRTWDDWRVVTPRMQRLMTAALQKGTVSTYTGGSTAFPTGWAVGGGVGAILVAGLLLGAWRRPDLAARLRPSRYRLSS